MYQDRYTIGNARVAGMQSALHMTNHQVGTFQAHFLYQWYADMFISTASCSQRSWCTWISHNQRRNLSPTSCQTSNIRADSRKLPHDCQYRIYRLWVLVLSGDVDLRTTYCHAEHALVRRHCVCLPRYVCPSPVYGPPDPIAVDLANQVSYRISAGF